MTNTKGGKSNTTLYFSDDSREFCGIGFVPQPDGHYLSAEASADQMNKIAIAQANHVLRSVTLVGPHLDKVRVCVYKRGIHIEMPRSYTDGASASHLRPPAEGELAYITYPDGTIMVMDADKMYRLIVDTDTVLAEYIRDKRNGDDAQTAPGTAPSPAD